MKGGSSGEIQVDMVDPPTVDGKNVVAHAGLLILQITGAW